MEGAKVFLFQGAVVQPHCSVPEDTPTSKEMNVQIKESREIMGCWKETFIVQNDSMILCFWLAKQVLEMTGSYVNFF